ncbi:LysR family transcriptional regulator [Duganella sp. P38]|uniref:LysR family transcriptional regulator n=1 Tax=Duganella sp. P38 TaxID=3423949 RepID=UPI003D7B3B7F
MLVIDGLKCFVTVAELSSLSKAAVQLEMAVSSVSRKINALEDELGARLLLRSSRQVLVTDAGERFCRAPAIFWPSWPKAAARCRNWTPNRAAC